MSERRKYTRKQKLATIMAAEMVGVTEAAKVAGIPHANVSYWLHDPKYDEFRRKAREDLVEEVRVAAHLLWKRVVETADQMEPRDALFGAEKASTILQLLSGQATARTESRELPSFEDHETTALAELAAEVLRERADVAVE